jgi:hypothetical protein
MDKYLASIEDYLKNGGDMYDPRFGNLMYDAVDALEKDNVGSKAVVPILELMERYPLVDFGNPGALVHFVEQFDSVEYDTVLARSVQKSPTLHTLWMLNRILNSANEQEEEKYIEILEAVADNKAIPKEISERAEFFL